MLTGAATLSFFMGFPMPVLTVGGCMSFVWGINWIDGVDRIRRKSQQGGDGFENESWLLWVVVLSPFLPLTLSVSSSSLFLSFPLSLFLSFPLFFHPTFIILSLSRPLHFGPSLQSFFPSALPPDLLLYFYFLHPSAFPISSPAFRRLLIFARPPASVRRSLFSLSRSSLPSFLLSSLLPSLLRSFFPSFSPSFLRSFPPSSVPSVLTNLLYAFPSPVLHFVFPYSRPLPLHALPIVLLLLAVTRILARLWPRYHGLDAAF